ncbi:MAG TPA: hypothetical protein VFI17_06090 [Solirubrobacterales bacterium]|nr:hypothetical protein [Solirubrobacterales bacterium]
MKQDEPGSQEERAEERLAEEEAEAAATEAGEIGGPAPFESDDPAERPLVEAGEGEAEGFELAEQQLEDIASHGDQHRFPSRKAPPPEERADSTYSEPDQTIPDDE